MTKRQRKFEDVWHYNRSMMACHGVCLDREVVERLINDGHSISFCKEYIAKAVNEAIS